MIKYTEAALEQAFVELYEQIGFSYNLGTAINLVLLFQGINYQ